MQPTSPSLGLDSVSLSFGLRFESVSSFLCHDLTQSHPLLVLVSNLSPSLCLVSTWSRPLLVLVLTWSPSLGLDSILPSLIMIRSCPLLVLVLTQSRPLGLDSVSRTLVLDSISPYWSWLGPALSWSWSRLGLAPKSLGFVSVLICSPIMVLSTPVPGTCYSFTYCLM